MSPVEVLVRHKPALESSKPFAAENGERANSVAIFERPRSETLLPIIRFSSEQHKAMEREGKIILPLPSGTEVAFDP